MTTTEACTGFRGFGWGAACAGVFVALLVTTSAPAITYTLVTPSSASNPAAGQTVTYQIAAANPDSSAAGQDITVSWTCEAGTWSNGFNHEVQLEPQQTKTYAEQVTFGSGGRYTVRVCDALGGDPEATFTINVAHDYADTDSEVRAALTCAVTHSPETPCAETPQRGMPDRRDTITLTYVFTSTSAKKTIPQHGIVVYYYLDGVQQGMQGSFTVPELVAGQEHTFTQTTKLNPPGTWKLEVRWGAYPGPILATHSFSALGYGAPALSNPEVTPAQGLAGEEFTFSVTCRIPDNTAPTAVKLLLAALPGEEYAMTPVDAGDTNYMDGKDYEYDLALPLNAFGEISMCFRAYAGGTVTAETGFVPGPTIIDDEAPAVGNGGVDQQPIIQRSGSSVALSGTATDAQGPLEKVEWRVAGGSWQNTTGRENWSFIYDSGAQDQDFITKDFEVRAYDMAGNVTHPGDYWRQRVIWERRHPKIVDKFVTDMAQGIPSDSAPTAQTAKPANSGNPKLNETYIIALKVTNPNTTDAYTFDFCWKEVGVTYEPGNPPWALGMDSPGYCTGGPVTIGPGETKWVCTYWSHHWSWIKEKGVYDILCDMIFAYIPVAGDLYSGLSAIDFLCTCGFAVQETQWTTERAEGMPESVCGGQYTAYATVEVPMEKKLWLVDSVTAGLAANVTTAAGMALGWCPAGWAMLITEAVLIGTSQVCYYTAWDPSPDFQKRVTIEPIELDVPEEFRDDPQAKTAEAACRFAENIIAMKEAYIRGLGAEEGGKPDLARQHYEDAVTYLKEAGLQAKPLDRQMSEAAKTLKTATDEQRRLVDEFARAGELPEAERAFLTKVFGADNAALSSWGKSQSRLIPEVMKDPDSGPAAMKLFIKTLPQIEKELRSRTTRLKDM